MLGPALFLFYINDLPGNIKSNTRLVADDTIVYNTDGDQLQKDLLHLERWALDWSMEFNTIKSEHILFSRKRSPSTLKFMLNNTEVPKTNEVKVFNTIEGWKLEDDVEQVSATQQSPDRDNDLPF